MSSDSKTTALQLRSLIKASGELELSLARIAIPEPGADEVLVRVEAAPINPSDLGLLVGAADLSTARSSGAGDSLVVTASVPPGAMKAMAGRLDESLPAGNEAPAWSSDQALPAQRKRCSARPSP
jgi:NADPH:quinone reductase-like Zn-dependent oxidoreductase